jgi:CHAT domain-containing protein
LSWSDEQTLSALNKTQLQELPGTLKEMKELQNIFPSAKIYPGKKATRKNFIKSYTDPGIRLIVLSMHGRANSNKQDDICLFFRGVGSKVDTFYGYELLPLVSNVETILLLACETSKGKSLEGEGNYNLVRYFLANGAQNVISSIWDLSDVTSEGIITQMDANFTNGNFSKILHQNKINIINDNDSHRQQPWFWAGTVLFE